ncbi:MAG: flagellar basal body P-ring protein FlgI [Thermodesulfobacteriota bacterium]
MKKGFFQILCLFMILAIFSSPSWGARLKDIATFKGIRNNQLIGYGLVVGLNGTGDSPNAEFTIRSISNMLERMGVHIPQERLSQIRLKNVAAVIVTASLPPFSKVGNKIDVHVSSLADATSLAGGTLLLTPLIGPDKQVYALAQGPIAIGGFAFSGASGSGVQKNHPTVGIITRGAVIEREVPVSLNGKKELFLTLFNPDFTTAEKVKEAINHLLGLSYASCVDSGTIQIDVPYSYQQRIPQLISLLEQIEVTPDTVAKVIINERTGTLVLGEKVRISTVAVAHGNLNIQIKEKLHVSQPNPFAPPAPPGTPTTVVPPREGTGTIVTPGSATVVTPESTIGVKEERKGLVVLSEGVDLGELVRALNALGVTPRDLITILQSIKAAGALQAELEIH